MTYDDLLRKVSGRRFEMKMFLLFFFNGFPNAFIVSSLALILYTPEDYHCTLPDEVSVLVSENSSAMDAALDYLIPPGKTNETRSQCLQYNRTSDDISSFMYSLRNLSNVPQTHYSSENGSTMPCATGRTFSDPYNVKSAAIEFDISCEQSGIKPLVSLGFYIGISIGSIFGIAADRFGRRPVFILFTYALFIAMFAQSFMNTPWSYGITLFFGGLSSFVNYVTGFVLGAELTIPEKRNVISISSFVSFGIGCVISTLAFYLSPDWRWFLRSIGLMAALYTANIWLTPESPRWLMANGRIEEAKKVLRMIGKTNNKTNDVIEDVLKDVQQVAEDLMKERKSSKSKANGASKSKLFKGMLKSPRILIILVSTAFTWFCVTLVYYGISLSVQSFSGNIYINNTLMGFVEIPGYAMAYFAVKYLNRSFCHGGMMIGSGVCCMGAALLNEVSPYASTAIGLAGKCLNAGAFYLVYIHTTEIFPTLLRNSCMSLGSLSGRIGSLITPYLVYMAELHGIYSPFIVMSLLTVTSGICTLVFLPDTNNQELPETVDDMLRMKTVISTCYKSEVPKKIKESADGAVEKLIEMKP